MLYARRLFPWTVRLVSLGILLSAYGPSFGAGWGVFEWLYYFGANAVRDALALGELILDARWDALQEHWARTGYTGWLTFFAWRIGIGIVKRIRSIYSWPLHRLMSKTLQIDVTPTAIRIGRGGFETDAVGALAVAPHHQALEHSSHDQIMRDYGRVPTGKSFFYQNSYNIMLPYHGQPVVIMSMFGNKLDAERVAARITTAMNLVRQQRTAAPGGDEFGPAPSLPGES